MAKRDLEKTAARVMYRVPSGYDLTHADLTQLHDMAEHNFFEAICTAFNFGYVMGHRATEAGKYEENKKTKA